MPPHRYYYLHNFQRALDWIATRYPDLLDASEQAFLASFAHLTQPAQALLVRLLMRRGPWFRRSRLAYDEIPDLDAAAAPLLAHGWLDAQAPLDAAELAALHTRAELLALFAPLEWPRSIRKRELVEALQQRHPEPQAYAQWWPASGDAAWRVTLGPLCERLRLMFFGNLRQDWSEFVLADLGVLRYESVAFDAASRAFHHRADIDCYLALQACRDALEAGTAPEALLADATACASDNVWLEQRRARLLLRIGQACERQHDWPLALQAYAHCQHPDARQRRVRMHERMGHLDEACALALQALQAPANEAENQRLARMLPRLLRGLGAQAPRPQLPQLPQLPQTQQVPQTELVLPYPPGLATASVEWQVRAHLHQDSAPVHYVENTLVGALFGLLCWPALFAPLPGAFFHPFQRGPADLDAPDFAQRRQALFAQCLDALDTGAYHALILQRFEQKHGLQCPFVHWGAIDAALLEQALHCIPPAHLRAFFTRLLDDPRGNRSGLPDLVRFWPAEQRYALIEVKGPGDRLQDNQLRWLRYCIAHGIPVSVCHVRWAHQDAGGHTVPDETHSTARAGCREATAP